MQSISKTDVGSNIHLRRVNHPWRYKKQNKMEIALNSPDGRHKIKFSNIIKWHRRVKKKDKNVLNLHIQFHYLDEKNADVLMKYFSLASGDKNLFWNLWDDLSMHS